MIINVFSKYGWAIPLKTKKGPEVAKAFSDLWKTQKPPKKLWRDKGAEFINKYMTASLTKYNVHLYWTENEEKSCVVERWNRTIKRMMWKYFTKHQTGIYINILPKMIKKYNSTYHRSIKCTPADARKPANYQHVFDALYAGKNRRIREKTKPKFKIGDKVRITKKKKTFGKGYTTNWTEEIITVVKVQPTIPVTYKIEDTRGEEIQGTFYEPELQKTKQEIHRIEKFLRRRTRKDGVKEVYVKWKGYNEKFNQWIPEPIFNKNMNVSDSYSWNTGKILRSNNLLLPQNIPGLIVGKSNCGKTTLLLNLLLQSDLLDYNHLYVFGKSLHQQEYQILKKEFTDSLSKNQVSNLFLNQEVLVRVNLSPQDAIDTYGGVRSGSVKADFYDDCSSIPDPADFSMNEKNLLILDDYFRSTSSNDTRECKFYRPFLARCEIFGAHSR